MFAKFSPVETYNDSTEEWAALPSKSWWHPPLGTSSCVFGSTKKNTKYKFHYTLTYIINNINMI